MSEEKFNCPGCSSRTCARIDQQIVDGTFAPGPWVRCVECKRDTLLPLPRPPFNATLQVPDSAGNAGGSGKIEQQDAQIAMGMIVEAESLDIAQSIAASFLEGRS